MVSTDVMAWTYCFHHLMACADRIKMFLQNIHNHVCTTRLYGVLTQPHYESSPLWAPQIPYQMLLRTETLMEKSHDENWITEQQYIFHTVLNITYFFHLLCTVIYILHLKKLRKQTIFNKHIYTHILWSGPHMLNFKLLPQSYKELLIVK